MPKEREPARPMQPPALAFAGSYVIYRERLGLRWMSALGLGSMAAGAGRLLLDRHWTSDIIGGYFIGTSLGALTSAVYEYRLSALSRAQAAFNTTFSQPSRLLRNMS